MSTSSQSGMEEMIIATAWKNEAVRKELMDDPKAALKREFGYHFPAKPRSTSSKRRPMSFVLPLNPAAEQSTAQLDTVRSGRGTSQPAGTTMEDMDHLCCGNVGRSRLLASVAMATGTGRQGRS